VSLLRTPRGPRRAPFRSLTCRWRLPSPDPRILIGAMHALHGERAVPGRWNIRCGLIRAWVLFATVWLTTVGGVWLSTWWVGSSDYGTIAWIERAMTESERRAMFSSALFVLGVPAVLFAIGFAFWWVAMGLKAHTGLEIASRKEQVPPTVVARE